MTEITDNINIGRGLIFFDAACGVCNRSAQRLGAVLERRGFRVLPLQAPEATLLTGATMEELLEQVHLVTATRQVLRGVDALLYVAAAIPWARPLRWLARAPGMKRGLDVLYRAFATHRYQISRSCGIDGDNNSKGNDAVARFLPGLILVALAFAAGRLAAPWVWMWMVALAIFFACKWAAWWPVRRRGTVRRNLAYFLAWPGMDAESFLVGPAPARPTKRQWLAATLKTACGAALVWIVARQLESRAPAAAAWAGMIGLAMLLHFGLMHLAALAWRRAGVPAEPLMQQPARSTSLAEFWGRRWNTGFRFLAHDLLFRRLVRRLGIGGATAVVFVVSGIIHDAVISIPARGGYGLPTVYFLLQLVGVLAGRSDPLKWVGRARFVGWAYVVAFTVLPLPLLFHTAFIHNVIVPFLHAIGGLS